jgi:hypothetical protein
LRRASQIQTAARVRRQSAYGNLGPDLQASNDHIADYQQRAAKAAEQKVYASERLGQTDR